MGLYSCVLFFTLISSIATLAIQNELEESKNSSNSRSVAHTGETNCHKGECKTANCKCCPGYALKIVKVWILNTYSCEKCNCGNDFGCEFKFDKNSLKNTKICFCSLGYSDISGLCKADCKKNPCQNNGKCIVKSTDIVCKCEEPYIGERCEKNKCAAIECQNGGECVIEREKPKCKCGERYSGEFCETDKCAGLECQNMGECIIEEEKAKCKCGERYSGEFCETDKCTALECQNMGECIIEQEKAKCKCGERYSGEFCETEKCNNRNRLFCENDGICIVKDGKPTCKCSEKYTGVLCHLERCESECKNGGTCILKGGRPACLCTEKYGGELCEKVSSTYCYIYVPNCLETGGICVADSEERITCSCPNGTKYVKHTGCLDRCPEITCQNGGTCYMEDGIAFCRCPENYTGDTCEKVPCKPNPCENGGFCKFRRELWEGFSCLCPERYIGETCEIDRCADVSCYNEGTCNTEYFVPHCECVKGFTGKMCETYPEYACKSKIENCIETKGVCKSEDEINVRCECPSGEIFVKGVGCTNVCEDAICYNGGACKSNNGTAHCECVNWFTGKSCEIYPEVECKSKIIKCAETGGVCKSVDDKSITCDCPVDTSFVEKHGCKNKCSLIKCQNNGTCEIKDGRAVCKCTDEYTGKYCEKDVTSLVGSGDDIVISLYINKNSTFAKGTKFDFHFGRKQETNRTRTQILLRLNSESAIPTTKECTCKNGRCQEISGKVECICYPEFGKYEEGICKACECGKGANCSFTESDSSSVFKNKSCICPKNSTEIDGVCVDQHAYNPCSSNPCKNGGLCEKNGFEAKCICLPGYNGILCQYDECSLFKCQNDGKCEIKNGKPICACQEMYTGDYCEIDKCSLINCQNGGTCGIKNEKAVCVCEDKYFGDYCEMDKCSLIKCLNGGKCEIRNQKAACICRDNFAGDYCEKRKS